MKINKTDNSNASAVEDREAMIEFEAELALQYGLERSKQVRIPAMAIALLSAGIGLLNSYGSKDFCQGVRTKLLRQISKGFRVEDKAH